jgi:secreted Zn-dependent insulinase-like peptidase
MADMAYQAGIKSNFSVTSKYIRLNYQCYNDKIKEYLEYLADNFDKCEMDQVLFKNTIDKKIRTQKNILKGEPYSKIMMYFQRAVLADHTPEQYIDTYNSITYEEFLEFKG